MADEEHPKPETPTWMSQEVSKWLGSMGYVTYL